MKSKSYSIENSNLEPEKIHYGSILIAIGFILLFAGTGNSLGIADNFLFFLMAIVLNMLTFIFRLRRFSVNYTIVVMAYFAYITYAYESGGMGDFGYSMSIIMYALLIISCILADYNTKDLEIIKKGVIISSCIFAFLVLFKGDYYLYSGSHKYTYKQTFGQYIEFEPNYLGLLMLCGCELCLLEIVSNKNLTTFKRIMYLFLSGFLALGTLQTGSRSAFVSVAVFILCLILFTQTPKMRKRLIYIILLVIVLLPIIIQLNIIPQDIFDRLFTQSYDDGSNLKRVTNWAYGMKAMYNHWIIGNGPKPTINILFEQFGYIGDAHNTFITYGIWYGVLGFGLFISYILYLMVKLWKQNNKVMVALLISMVIQWNILACNFTMGMWMIIMILVLQIHIYDKKKRDEKNGKRYSTNI